MTASEPRRDILLLVCRVVLYVLLAVFGLALLLVSGITLFGAVANPDLASRMAFLNIVSVVLIGIAFRFVQLLGRIIDSVAKTDPFNLANSRRLHEMAWLALAFQLIALILHSRGGDIRIIHINGVEVLFSSAGGISLHGFLLALVLFILARVFRKGADMRDELEGTV